MPFKFNPGKSAFLKNSLTVFTGTSLAQVITFAVSLVLARLYNSTEFGDFALFTSMVAIIAVISTARYELAIMLPKEQRDAASILVLSMIIASVVSLVVLAAVALGNTVFAGFFADASRAVYWLYLLPVAVFLRGIHQALKTWTTRHEQYKRNAVGAVANAATKAGVNTGLGLVKFGATGLIAGQVAGQFIDLMVLARGIYAQRRHIFRDVTKATIRANRQRYANFARINSPHALIDNLKEHGIVFLLTYFFTASILGQYALTIRVLKAPVGLIGSSLSQVFYQRASATFAEGKSVQPLIREIYKRNLMIALPLFSVLLFVTPWLFVFFFGEEWKEAGEIGQLLIPWLFFQFMASPVSSIAIIANKQQQAMYFSIADLFLRAAALAIGAHFAEYKLAFMLISLMGSGLLIYALFWYYRIARNDQNSAY